MEGMQGGYQQFEEQSGQKNSFFEADAIGYIFENFHEGLFILDTNFNILTANRWIREHFGDNIIGKKCCEVFRRDNHPLHHPESLNKLINEEGIHHVFIPPEESSIGRWLEVFLHPFKDKNNNLIIMGHLRDITENKKLEEEIMEEKNRFENIARNSRIWVWEVDKEGRYIYSGKAVESLLGYKPEEVEGKYFYDFFVPEEREELKRKAFEVFGKKEPFISFVNKLVRKDGNIIVVETNGTPVLSRDGNLLGYRGMDIDVTERFEAERRLRESEEKFKSMINDVMNHAEIGILITDRNSRIVWINESLESYFGIKGEEVIGKTRDALFRDNIFSMVEKPQEVEKIFIAPGTQEMAKRMDIHVLPDEGREERWLEYKSMTISEGIYEGGRIDIYLDITERKILENRLRESLDIFHPVATYTKDAIIMIDDEGRVIFWNKGAESMFGYTAEEMAGRDIHMICAPQRYLEMYRKGFEVFKYTGKGNVIDRTLEMTAIRKNGEEFPVELTVSSFTIKGRWHALAIIRDISERKKLEIELRRKVEEMERFFKLAVDRENRIIELKKEVNELCKKCGEKPRYSIVEQMREGD